MQSANDADSYIYSYMKSLLIYITIGLCLRIINNAIMEQVFPENEEVKDAILKTFFAIFTLLIPFIMIVRLLILATTDTESSR